MYVGNLLDKMFPISKLVNGLQYVMVFKTTNYCWYNCPHCCESSGPNQQKYYIPAPVIKKYISQGLDDKLFSRSVVFTGGEIMSAYKFGDKNYVPELLTFCQDKAVGVNIKTNAAWVNAGFGHQIFDDLRQVISNGAPYTIQISLSLDEFHKNSVSNCVKFIDALHRYKNMHAIVHTSSFSGEEHLYKELIKSLKDRGVLFNKAILPNGKMADVAGDSLLLLPSFNAVLFDGGRAKNLPQAQKTYMPQFKFLTPDKKVLMAFDSFGCVTLGENSGRKIRTKWCADEDLIYSLPHIRKKLVNGTRMEEIRTRILNKSR